MLNYHDVRSILKINFKVCVADAEKLFDMLPAAKLLTYNLPPTSGGLVDAVFTTTIDLEELTKLVQQAKNGRAMMESLKINYD